jgi:hypothetical protein
MEVHPQNYTTGHAITAVGFPAIAPLIFPPQTPAQLPAIDGGPAHKPPTLVLASDQGEELFLAEAQGEAQRRRTFELVINLLGCARYREQQARPW